MADPFAATDPAGTTLDPDKVTLEDLVGENKRYKTIEDLARAAVHKDVFISQLQTETKELREDLTARLSVADALKEIQNKASATNTGTDSQDQTPAVTETTDVKALTIEDVEKLLETRTAKQRESDNLTSVITQLDRVAGGGEKTKAYVEAKAKELNTTPARLKELGAESPAVLYKLLGIEPSKATPPEVTRHTPTQSFRPNTTQPTTHDDFRELRKTNPALYFSPDMQAKLLKVRMDEIRNRK